MSRIIFLVGILFFFNANIHAEEIVLGAVPQQSAKKIAVKWIPLLKIISHGIGKKKIFATAKGIPTFEKRLANQKYDIAYMYPYNYTIKLSGFASVNDAIRHDVRKLNIQNLSLGR